jgi:polyvinyl alcohol dehydrogenase (cytochrome)
MKRPRLAGLALRSTAIAAMLIIVLPAASSADAASSGPSTYQYDLQRSGYAAGETTLNASSASSLTVKWSTHAAESTTQPIVSGGRVFWSTWDGYLRANDVASGDGDWSLPIGFVNQPDCGGVTGPDSTPAVASVSGRSTVFVGGGTGQFLAVDAATGQVLWQVQLAQSPPSFVWSSPAYYNDHIYIGIASVGDCPLVQGRLVELDAASGATVATFNAVPDGCTGASIWSSPTIDETTDSVYVTTGNAGDCPADPTEPYSEAIVRLRASDLGVVDVWQTPNNLGDNDFGATPTLFSGKIGGLPRNLVGAVNKNGYFYALDRDHLADGPVWTDFIGVPGLCGSCYAAYLASAAWDGSSLYVGGDQAVIAGQNCPGSLRALDPDDGTERWTDCLTQGRVLGAVIAAPGVVAANAGDHALVVDSTKGDVLFDYTERSTNYFFGAASISDGVLYVANNDGNLLAFAPTTGPVVPEIPYPVLLVTAGLLPGVAAIRSTRRRRRLTGT